MAILGETLAVLDANVFLEFKDFAEIDWHQLLQAKRVTLLVTLPVLKDLDKAKIGSGRRRDRAVSVLRRLSDLTKEFGPTEATIREGVKLRVQHATISDLPAGLDKSNNDDMILAIVLELDRGHSGNAVLVTDDSVLKAKGKLLGLRVLSMPEDIRRPTEPAPESKEVARLRAEMDELRSRLPQPSLFLRVGVELVTQTAAQVRIPRKLRREDLENRIEKVRTQYQEIVAELRKAPPQTGGFASVMFRQVPPEDIREFEDEVKKFLDKYEEYLEEVHKWERVAGRQVSLRFVARNEGLAPAEETYVLLRFPNEVDVGEEPFPNVDVPDRPTVPSKLSFPLLATLSPVVPSIPLLRPEFSILRGPNPSAPRIRKGESIVAEFGPKDLMHGGGFGWELDPIWLTFPDYKDGQIFPLTIPYEIHAANLPQHIKGVIEITTNYVDVEPWTISADGEDNKIK